MQQQRKGKAERLNLPFVVLIERARERKQRRGIKGEGKKRAGRASSVILFVGRERAGSDTKEEQI